MIGLRELMLVAAVVLVLYGRSGVLKSRQFQTIWPWISPQRRMAKRVRSVEGVRPPAAEAIAAQSSGRPKKRKTLPFFLQGSRLYWFLTILAATALATVILGRIMISSGAGPGLTH